MGFKPNSGSIFFSPTLTMKRAVEEGFKNVDWSKFMVVPELPQVTPRKIEDPLYGRMNFCIACGSFLVPYELDIKECPHRHGRFFTGNGFDELPVITFVEIDEGA